MASGLRLEMRAHRLGLNYIIWSRCRPTVETATAAIYGVPEEHTLGHTFLVSHCDELPQWDGRRHRDP